MSLADWPFTQTDLLRGLRQYLAAPNLKLVAFKERATIPDLPGTLSDSSLFYKQRHLIVKVDLQGFQYDLGLTLHQAQVDFIRREIGLYRRLAEHLPIIVPVFVNGDAKRDAEEGWFITVTQDDLRAPAAWNVDDYREAIDNLARLHDRFWGLAEDLDTFEWLEQPLGRDLIMKQVEANEALSKLQNDWPPLLDSPQYHAAFSTLANRLRSIAAPLLEEPFTLTHGEYWPGNIARPLDGNLMITRWHHAAIAPAILDIVLFNQMTTSHLNPAMALKAAVARYQIALTDYQKRPIWSEKRWELLWDHALMWQFTTQKLPWLAALPTQDYPKQHPKFEQAWLIPTLSAIGKRL